MYVNNYFLGVSFSLFTSNKTWGEGVINFIYWKTECFKDQFYIVSNFRTFDSKKRGYKVNLNAINYNTSEMSIYEIAKKI